MKNTIVGSIKPFYGYVKLVCCTIASGALLSAWSTHADTVALWKLDCEADGMVINGRCLLNPLYDLQLSGTAAVAPGAPACTPLPATPDSSDNLLASPINGDAIKLGVRRTAPFTHFINENISSCVNITNNFTVEGWINFTAVPTGNSWGLVVGNHNSGSGRWLLTLRQGGTNWIMYVQDKIYDVAFPIQNDPATLTNSWLHIALTYDGTAGDAQKGVWELFVNGNSYGSLTNSSPITTLTTSDSIFHLGGRSIDNRTCNASLDYWRISDRVLQPAELLNAGVAMPPSPPETTTIAYWRMDSTASNEFDIEDYVGGAHLASHREVLSHDTTIRAATTQSFDGQPPNSTITLPEGNGGSIYAQGVGACLRVPELGTFLEITNSFTVEGWISPHRQDYNAAIQYIANTRISDRGWALALKQLGAERKLVIYAADEEGALVNDLPLSVDLSAWYDEWKHLALVYDHTAGEDNQGVWFCYLDGTLQGVATNGHIVVGDSNSQFFHLAGRTDNASTFCGYLDCWRVSQTALTPNQFLNAIEDAIPATSVLALWPLNSSDGLYMDTRDLTGNYSFSSPLDAMYKISATSDQAVATLPNPDKHDNFKGDAARNSGSIIFNTPANSAPRAYLSTTDTTVRNTLCLTNSFTWETWLKRTTNPGAWQLLFGTANTVPRDSTGAMRINFTYRTNGYVLYVVQGGVDIIDIAFAGSNDINLLNVWRHLALVYDVDTDDGVWRLYLDGQLQGTIANNVAATYFVPSAVYFGGRHWSASSFNGAMDNIRLTKGALAPEQFLIHPYVQPIAPVGETVAYWKLDFMGGLLDAQSQVEPRYSFIHDGLTPMASEEEFRKLVPQADATLGFIGNPKENHGAAHFYGYNYLHVQNVGLKVDLDQPFTVEGWLLWNNQTENSVQTIVGTIFDTAFGWRLTLNKVEEEVRLGLYAAAPNRTPIINQFIQYDALQLEGRWHHLALTFAPRGNDTGTWELFVDGKSIGNLNNVFYPSSLLQSHWFTLGGELGGNNGFDGLMDCWRVTSGVLAPEEFLNHGYNRGTLLMLQ